VKGGLGNAGGFGGGASTPGAGHRPTWGCPALGANAGAAMSSQLGIRPELAGAGLAFARANWPTGVRVGGAKMPGPGAGQLFVSCPVW